MNNLTKPTIIEFPKVGSPEIGYLTVAENTSLPFKVQRIYWTYYTPDNVVRGHHAHFELEQFIFAVSGAIEFELEDIKGNKTSYLLNRPNQGLYIPKLYWRTIKFSHNAVLLCLASLEYSESDYIRSYEDFSKLKV